MVKVHAASLNAADLETLRGMFWIRFGESLRPMYKILGFDIAGQVAAVGKNIKQFQPGDEVFGSILEQVSYAYLLNLMHNQGTLSAIFSQGRALCPPEPLKNAQASD